MPEKTVSSKQTPYWLVGAKLNTGESVAAIVDAPTNGQAKAEGGRIIASQTETADFTISEIRGPFPQQPGDAASQVRPDLCPYCGNHCWDGNEFPRQDETWFTRKKETDDVILWECLTCNNEIEKIKIR